MAYRVLLAQFMHETNTSSKLPTTLDDYRRRFLVEGEAIVPKFKGTRNEMGAVFDIPHGHTSCIMLPAVMRWNRSANAAKQATIAAAMGHPGKHASDVLDAFIRGLGMPRSLAEVKVGRENFDRIAAQAMATPWVPRNPRPIPGPAEVKEILELAAG